MHTRESYQATYKAGSTIAAQELTRNNMEIAGLVVYLFTLAMVFTLLAILMLFGLGIVADTQASMHRESNGQKQTVAVQSSEHANFGIAA